jgi:hypothetical protein
MAVSSLALAVALTSLSSFFLTLTLCQRPNPFARCAHQPIHPCLHHPSLRYGSCSLRSKKLVGPCWRLLHRPPYFFARTRSLSPLLVRHLHVWLTWLFTSFTYRVRSHMVHSQYQHGPRLFFDKESFFVVLVLLHAIPPGGFCSSLLCRFSHPIGLGTCFGCSTFVLI